MYMRYIYFVEFRVLCSCYIGYKETCYSDEEWTMWLMESQYYSIGRMHMFRVIPINEQLFTKCLKLISFIDYLFIRSPEIDFKKTLNKMFFFFYTANVCWS